VLLEQRLFLLFGLLLGLLLCLSLGAPASPAVAA